MMKAFIKTEGTFGRLVGARHVVALRQESAKRKVFLLILGGLLLSISPLATAEISAQTRWSKANWNGHWNWAIYAKDKSELPPFYQDTKNIKEVPAWALDLTLRQSGNKLSGSWGLLARYLAHVDEGDIATTIRGNRATLRLTSNFGGSGTILLTLRGNQLSWKLINSSDQNFFPREEVLRRVRRGEKLPYVADEETEAPR